MVRETPGAAGGGGECRMSVDWRDVRVVGFGLLVTGLSVAYLANAGKITGGVMMIVGATVLIAGLVAKQRPTN